MKNKHFTEKDIEQIAKEIEHSFACEGMYLDQEDKDNCLSVLRGEKCSAEFILEYTERWQKEGKIHMTPENYEKEIKRLKAEIEEFKKNK